MPKTSLFASPDNRSYFRPFALITSLFLLWGFAHGLLDVLDKHFQTTLHISKAESGFVQFSLYIGYLVMAYPAGVFMKRYGYRNGILLGLGLFASGAFLFSARFLLSPAVCPALKPLPIRMRPRSVRPPEPPAASTSRNPLTASAGSSGH